MRDRFHLTKEVSVVPTVLVLLNMAFMGWQYYSDSEYRSESRVSLIGARVDQYHQSKVIIIPGPNNFDPFVYRKKAKITLSNNGFHTGSIVGWGFYLPLEIEDEGDKKTARIWAPGIEPKLKTTDGKDFEMPLNIEPGESESFVVEYNVGISEQAYQLLPEDLKNDNIVDWRSIERELRDIYDSDDYSEYMVELVKSDGNIIVFRFTNYGSNGFMQGEKSPEMASYPR